MLIAYFGTILAIKRRIHKKGKTEMVIHWYYEEDDEDMLEAGGDYEAIVTVPFEKIAVEEE